MSKSFWLMSAGLVALGAAPAHAQNNTTPTGQSGPLQQSAEVNPNTDVSPTDTVDPNEIVVTAQGRTQVLQDVPIAVSAVSAESLQNSGASDIRQLNQLAPSLLVSSTGTEANGSARIRGIGTVGDNPGLESSVAVFIDGVYRSRTGVGLNELGEIERVEVLRGPQGTLFGRNASAGLLNIISKKPNLNKMEGFAEATYGNYDAMRLSGGITGPLGASGLGFRLDGVWSKRDGFLKNITAAGGSERRVNNRNRYFVRGQLLYEPNDQISVRLIGDYSHRNESCCGAVYLSTLETTDPTPGVPGDFAVAASNRIVSVLQSLGGIIPPNPFDRQIAITPGRTYRGKTTDAGVSGQVDWKLGENATLTSITAYRDYKSEGPSDTDYSNVDILYRDPVGGGYQRAFKTFSQELRLQGNAFEDKLDWLIGAYYAHEKLDVSDNLKFGTQYGAFAACRLVATVSPVAVLRNPAAPGCLSAAATAPGSPFSSTGALGGAGPLIASGLVRLSTVNNVGDNPSFYHQTSENWAIFTHNIFNITDKVALTIGLRYTNEDKKFSAQFNNNNAVCPVQQAAFANFLTGGTTPLPAALQPLVAGVVNLTCQGNATTALNALNLRDERKEDEWTGTGILSWKPINDLLLYASYSKGYKAGGFNLDRSALGNPIFSPSDPRQAATGGFGTANLQFDPEKVEAYEIGAKFGTRTIVLNAALFYQAFRNFQLNTFNGSVFLVQNINGCSSLVGGSATDSDPVGGLSPAGPGGCAPKNVKPGVISQGVEVEAAVYPVHDLQITAGFTYANTHYKKDLVGRSTGQPLDPALFLLPGDHLSNAPNLVGTASFTWTPRIGGSGLSALVYADARMSSDYNTGSDLFPEKEQNAFTVVNARLGIRGPAQRWALEVWAQNLFNQDYQQVAFNTPFQGSNSRAHVTNFGAPSFATANQLFSSYLAEPRTFGVTGRFRF
ncbi:MAG TPA: TonB-dependent receptor [Allosphingosinicella sp.]|jgi:outer membrane receptor protein involved in Fe transport